jgi:hypothetical protein
LHFAVPSLNESHSSLDESARDQELPVLRAIAIEFQNMLWLLRNIERITGFGLHPECELERFQASFDRFLSLAIIEMLSIELLQ